MEEFVLEFPKSNFVKKVVYSYLHFGEHQKNKVSEIITFYFCDGGQIEYLSYEKDKIENVFKEIGLAESVGKYWHKHIKNNSLLQYKRIR